MRLLALRAEIGDAVRSALPRARLAVEIADDLIAYPILTVAGAASRYGRSNEANRNAIGIQPDPGTWGGDFELMCNIGDPAEPAPQPLNDETPAVAGVSHQSG